MPLEQSTLEMKFLLYGIAVACVKRTTGLVEGKAILQDQVVFACEFSFTVF